MNKMLIGICCAAAMLGTVSMASADTKVNLHHSTAYEKAQMSVGGGQILI